MTVPTNRRDLKGSRDFEIEITGSTSFFHSRFVPGLNSVFYVKTFLGLVISAKRSLRHSLVNLELLCASPTPV